MNKALNHQDRKGQEMQPGQGLREAFVITGEAAETGHPAKTALDDPATGQEHETAFGFGQLDYNQVNARCLSALLGALTGIALVNEGYLELSPVTS